MAKGKSKGTKRPRENESDEDSTKSSSHTGIPNKMLKLEDKSEDKSANKRRSDERRHNAKFFAVCLTCYQYGISTIGEVADFSYTHMCESGIVEDDKKKVEEDKQNVVEALKAQVSFGSSTNKGSSTNATEAEAEANTTTQTPPSPPSMLHPSDKANIDPNMPNDPSDDESVEDEDEDEDEDEHEHAHSNSSEENDD